MKRALFDRLPGLARAALGVPHDADVRLFNEHYIVKRPGSGIMFRWHKVATRCGECEICQAVV